MVFSVTNTQIIRQVNEKPEKQTWTTNNLKLK